MTDSTAKQVHEQSESATTGSGGDSWAYSEMSVNSKHVVQLVVAAVLAALSVAVAPLASFIPRVPGGWGLAFFDPVSLFWIAAFLVAGPRVGFLSMGIGTIGLMFFDPTGIGPFFKLVATLPMLLIPWLGTLRIQEGSRGKALSQIRPYSQFMIVAFFLRLALMIPLNLIVVPLLAPVFTFEQIVWYVIIINAFQSFWDAAVPFVVVHGSPVFEHFGQW